MGIHTPLHIARSRPFEKERNVIPGVPTTGFVATAVTWDSRRRIKIRNKFYWTVWSCVFSSCEVEHLRCLGIQHTHHLKPRAMTSVPMSITQHPLFWLCLNHTLQKDRNIVLTLPCVALT